MKGRVSVGHAPLRRGCTTTTTPVDPAPRSRAPSTGRRRCVVSPTRGRLCGRARSHSRHTPQTPPRPQFLQSSLHKSASDLSYANPVGLTATTASATEVRALALPRASPCTVDPCRKSVLFRKTKGQLLSLTTWVTVLEFPLKQTTLLRRT